MQSRMEQFFLINIGWKNEHFAPLQNKKKLP